MPMRVLRQCLRFALYLHTLKLVISYQTVASTTDPPRFW
jgi:hypothetical protein